MITREPTIERLAIAQGLLLEPFGISESTLQRALATIGEHRVDDADLYFQTTRHEGWSLEEGIVKSGSFSIDQGVGVRAMAGEKTAFAYSDDSQRSLAAGRCAHRAHDRRRRPEQARQAGAARRASRASRLLYAPTDPIATLDSAQKVALLEKVEKLARAKDPRIVQVMASVGAEYDVVLIARADGTRAADVRPLVRLNVTVIAEQTVDGRSPRDRQQRRRRPLRPGLLPGRGDRKLCRAGGRRRADQPGQPPGAGRRHDRRARPGLARRAAARSRRPRPRRRLQPQGQQHLQRPHRPARRRQGRAPCSTTAPSPTAAAR